MKNALLLLATFAVLAAVTAPAAQAETNRKSALSPCVLFSAIKLPPIFDCGPSAGPVVQGADAGRVKRTKKHDSGRVDGSDAGTADSGTATDGGRFESPYDEQPKSGGSAGG